VPVQVLVAHALLEQYWRVLLLAHVDADALVQATQLPVVVSQTGVSPEQAVLTQLPLTHCWLVAPLQRLVVPVQA